MAGLPVRRKPANFSTAMAPLAKSAASTTDLLEAIDAGFAGVGVNSGGPVPPNVADTGPTAPPPRTDAFSTGDRRVEGMIAVLSDTHGREDARLAGRALEAVEAASLVVHAGDFTTLPVVEAFEAASARLVAVHGNVDDDRVRARLPARETIEVEGVRLVVVHGHQHGETARAMLGREEEAALVVSGHSHRPGVVDAGDVTLLNPGSHADPRGGIPAHAELEAGEGGLRGRLVDREGNVFEEFQA